jgi:hypothetical protein
MIVMYTINMGKSGRLEPYVFQVTESGLASLVVPP